MRTYKHGQREGRVKEETGKAGEEDHNLPHTRGRCTTVPPDAVEIESESGWVIIVRKGFQVQFCFVCLNHIDVPVQHMQAKTHGRPFFNQSSAMVGTSQ